MTANIWTNPQGQTRLLLPVDGSEPSLRAVDHAIGLAQTLSAPASIVLLNVQSRFSGDVQLFIGGDELHRYHEDEGRKQRALAQILREFVGELWSAGEFEKLMVLESLFVLGRRNKDVAVRFGIADEKLVAGIKFRAIDKLRGLARKADPNHTLFRGLWSPGAR
jgi:hypothetical protein